jgi:hypothetical protein
LKVSGCRTSDLPPYSTFWCFSPSPCISVNMCMTVLLETSCCNGVGLCTEPHRCTSELTHALPQDLVGSQIGKSGASWTTQILLLVLGSLSAALPFLGVAFFAVIITWVRATWRLKALMDQTEAQREAAGANMLSTLGKCQATLLTGCHVMCR